MNKQEYFAEQQRIAYQKQLNKEWIEEQIRIEKVYLYRSNLLQNNPRAFLKLPSFNVMVDSSEPLEDKYWVDQD